MNATLTTGLDIAALATISPLRPEDFSALRELHKQAVRATGWRFYSLQEVEAKLREIDDADYSTRLLAENGLAAKVGNTLVGTASWLKKRDEADTALITDVYTHPLFARGGVGSKLVGHIEQTVYKKGFHRLMVRSNLDSRRFYAKLGYASEGFEIYKIQATTQFPMQTMARTI